MRITGPMWFSGTLIMQLLCILVQCLLAWHLRRRADVRHAERLAAMQDLRDAVLRDSISGLASLTAGLREGYRALSLAHGEVAGLVDEIAAAEAAGGQHHGH